MENSTPSTKPPSSGQRVAAFVANVGEGQVFTKAELLAAVPNVSQADRRMRDLREIGWQIDNYKQNPLLAPNQYKLVKIGVRIDLGEKRPPARRGAIGAPQRRRIFERDGHMCQVCGIGRGERFDDDQNQVARLTIGHIIPVARGGKSEDENLRTECQRCNEQSRHLTDNPPDKQAVLDRATHLGSQKAKRELFDLMQNGHRFNSEIEKVFRLWQALPYLHKLEVQTEFSKQVLSD